MFKGKFAADNADISVCYWMILNVWICLNGLTAWMALCTSSPLSYFFSNWVVSCFFSLSYGLPLPNYCICAWAGHRKLRLLWAISLLNYLFPELTVISFLNHVLRVTSLWVTSSLSFSLAISCLGSLPFFHSLAFPSLSHPLLELLLWAAVTFLQHCNFMPFTRPLQTRKLSVSRTHESNTLAK